MSMMSRAIVRKTKSGLTSRVILLACAVVAGCGLAFAQTDDACGADGYRVIVRRWDAVLGSSYELRQDCAHPERPARSFAVSSASGAATRSALASPNVAAAVVQPLLVRAGEPVRLWMQDETVRIETSGVAEQSARSGERVTVRITHQTDDAGLTVQRITGIVRGAGDVEMER
jgi:hypothetical protein